MAHFSSTGSKMIINGKEVGSVREWDLTVDSNAEPMPSHTEDWAKYVHGFEPFEFEIQGTFVGDTLAMLALLYLKRLIATVTLPMVGEYRLEGHCNPEGTRAYFPSPAYPESKYFLMRVDMEANTLQRERVTSDLDDARQWVLYG